MLENIAQGKYAEMVDSYSALNMSSKIRGTLIEKEDKNIKIDIGDNQALEIELKENVEINPGETVLIDRRNIVKSKIIKNEQEVKVEHSEIDVYSDILKKIDIDVSEENIKIIKKLDSYGIDITKENFELYMISKNSLEEIATSLDYDSAIRLVEMDIDIENESIQKIAKSLEELEEEKQGFSILKMFGKKEITTEQAEQIAKDIYGGKMGKDITDIIKSLYKNKVSITKKNVEKINDVFYKLHDLKNIEDKTFVDTMKNKLDINIDNLYKIKRYVKDEKISTETDANIVKNIVNLRGYQTPTQEKYKVTNRELKLLEEDIKDLMIDLELDTSEENIRLSKEFIKRNMNVTKENIVNIDEMKKSLAVVIKYLDLEIASQIIKENIDLETADLRVIAEKIIEIKNPEKPELKQEVTKAIEKVEVKVQELNQDKELKVVSPEKKVELPTEEIKQLKQEVTKAIEKIEVKIQELNQDKELKVLSPEGKSELPIEEIKQLKQEVNKIIEKIEVKTQELNQDKELKVLSLEVKSELPVEDIKELKQEITKVIEKIEVKVQELNQDKELKVLSQRINNELPTEEIKQLKQEVNKAIEKIEIKAQEIIQGTKSEKPVVSEKKTEPPVEEIVKKIELLKKVDEKDILTLVEKNVDFKINKIEQVIFGKKEAVSMNTIQDTTYSVPNQQHIILENVAKDTIKTTVETIDKISTAFNEIGKLDFNTVAFQMKRNIPMTIMNMQKSSEYIKASDNQVEKYKAEGYQNNENTKAIQALNQNDIVASRLNIQKSMEVYKNYNYIKENLTSNMVKSAVMENIQIENMDLSLASKYIDRYRKTSLNYETPEQTENFEQIQQKQKIQNKNETYDNQVNDNRLNNKEEYAKTFERNAQSVAQNSDENIMFLIKNKKPISFKELKETHSLFKNQDQIGHKISEISELVHENGDGETKEKFERLKKEIIEISKSMKGSVEEVEEAYKRIEQSIKEIEQNIASLNQEQSGLMKKKAKEISEKIDENKVMAKENNIVQFPLYMNGQFTNLNMYFRDKERENSKKNSEDISVVLSIDTVNMGNLDINLEIDKKNIDIKIGLENMEDKNHMESYKENLKEILEQDGYSVREISFFKQGEESSFVKEDTPSEKPIIPKGNLDIKI